MSVRTNFHEYVREFGEGIDRIYREMAEGGQPDPEFKQYDFMLRATIRKVDPQDILQDTHQEATQKTTQKIVEAIMSNSNVSIEELALICGLTRDGINYHIRNLKKQGVLRRVGPDNGGHWDVITPIHSNSINTNYY